MPENAPPLLTHHSYWLRQLPAKRRFEALTRTHTTQVAVLGAGITGLSTAIELLEQGLDVTIVEALVLGGGTTSGSTGHLDAHPEMGCVKLLETLGEENARAATEYRLAAIRTIEARADAACEFQTISAYRYSEHSKDEVSLHREKEAALKLGLRAKWGVTVPLPFQAVGYEIEGLARIQCMAYLNRLLEIFLEKGGKIFEMSMASGPVEEEPHELEVGEGKIKFDQVVCAVHCNYTDAMRIYLQTPAYQSYAAAIRIEQTFPDALFWDNSDPYYYLRRAQSDDPHLVIVGGCDHRTGLGDPQGAADRLLKFAAEHFKVPEVVSSWSAELFEPTDGMPIIGRVPGKKNVWIATGLSGVGLTWGTAAGKILADQIAGKKTLMESELSPARFGLLGTPSMIGEQLASAANFAERVLPAAKINVNQLKAGEGKVGMVDGKFTAACRSQSGQLHLCNPRCVHMGGVVHWNEVEQTWDCPVHGGRYSNCGHRMYGPPEGNLVAPDEQDKE